MEHTKALDKIKKLLRLAASNNPHEAAAAMRQARALMDKHRLDEGDVALSEINECGARSSSKVNPSQWETNLAGCVRRAYACELLFIPGAGDWRFIGEFAEVAGYTMTVLLRQVRQARRHFITTNLKRCKSALKTKRADVFCDAWVWQVRQHVMAFAGSDDPSEAASAYLLKRYPNTEQSAARDRNAAKKDLSPRQIDAVLQEFDRLGWQSAPAKKAGRKTATPAAERKKLIGKIKAFLAEAERPIAYADGMALRMFKVERVEWLDAGKLRKMVAALSYDAGRHGRPQ